MIDSDPRAAREQRLTTQVYERLRREIVRGVLRPNEPLVEVEIAERLAVSRTPVRESLQRLASEGLIVSRRRRWAVHEHTKDEIRELYDVRAALESHAAMLAAQRATPEQIGALDRFRPQATAVNVNGHPHVEVNEQFHDLVNLAASSPRITALIQQNRHYHFNYRIASSYRQADFEFSSRQHGLIIDAIVARDPDLAARVAREHIAYDLEVIVARLF